MALATLKAVGEEAQRAEKRYGHYTSSHEALGVLTEEFHELVEAIRSNRREEVMREAIQVSAVAARLAYACASNLDDFNKRSGFKDAD